MKTLVKRNCYNCGNRINCCTYGPPKKENCWIRFCKFI